MPGKRKGGLRCGGRSGQGQERYGARGSLSPDRTKQRRRSRAAQVARLRTKSFIKTNEDILMRVLAVLTLVTLAAAGSGCTESVKPPDRRRSTYDARALAKAGANCNEKADAQCGAQQLHGRVAEKATRRARVRVAIPR
jgi:hypothetical protein